MADTLPYLASPGSVKTALDKIKAAATPDRVTGDFVSTKLQIRGGTGRALIPYLKKLGFVGSDGAPTDLYKRFRNTATSGAAVAEAMRIGYKALGGVNEYFYDLNDKDLLALIVQVTGAEAKSQVAKLTLSTFKTVRAFANFEASLAPAPAKEPAGESGRETTSGAMPSLKFGLSYTINLNLPATTDQAVFNAIFKSLREHLLADEE